MDELRRKQLRNMVAVGATSADSARLWMRSETAGPHELEVWPARAPTTIARVPIAITPGNVSDNTTSVRYPSDFPGVAPLKPLHRYGFRVRRVADGTPLGEGRFETAPAGPSATPKRYSFAFMSCHQPFNSDGVVSARAMRVLRLLPKTLADHDAKFVLLCGDQVYADAPGEFSLLKTWYAERIRPGGGSMLGWPVPDVRRAYQERYRVFWHMNEIRHLYANYPCYPMLDDHEIMDDWGSEAAHASAPFQSVQQGARQEYVDYQGSRVAASGAIMPASFHYSFRYGSLACFVMDVRSERAVGRPSPIYGRQQLADLQAFLRASTASRVVLIVTSVPVVHIAPWIADVGGTVLGTASDLPDHCRFGPYDQARNALLRAIHSHQAAHPDQRVVLLSGDVHLGCAFAIHWQGGTKPILYQFTSSAVSNLQKRFEIGLQGVGVQQFQPLSCGRKGPSARVNLLVGAGSTAYRNPFTDLNVGIVEVTDRGDHSNVKLKLMGPPKEDGPAAVEMFVSGEL